jgi:heme/copper-type cytochrome/quinol oxidase subunit 2
MIHDAALAGALVLIVVMSGAGLLALREGGLGEHPFGRTRREKRAQLLELAKLAASIWGGVFVVVLGVLFLIQESAGAREQQIENDAEAARRGLDRGGR